MAFLCEFCPASFSEKKTLHRHVRTKHSNTTFNCEKCNFSSNRKDKLKDHVSSKHFGNQFSCSKCSFSCGRKDNLIRHFKTYHEEQNNPLLPTPGFDWVEDLEQEERMQPPKSTNCTQCPASFKEVKNLNKHVKSVHADKEYACQHCDQIFNRLDVLKRHLPVHQKKKKAAKHDLFDEPCDER